MKAASVPCWAPLDWKPVPLRDHAACWVKFPLHPCRGSVLSAAVRLASAFLLERLDSWWPSSRCRFRHCRATALQMSGSGPDDCHSLTVWIRRHRLKKPDNLSATLMSAKPWFCFPLCRTVVLASHKMWIYSGSSCAMGSWQKMVFINDQT